MNHKDLNIYWIGGSFSGGKSTAARTLSDRFSLPLYSYDWHLLKDPVFEWFKVRDSSWFWMSIEDKLSRYRKAFPTAIEQIKKMSFGGPLIVEGPGLIPELISSVGIDPKRIIYLLPTPEFQRRVNPQRGPWVGEALAVHRDKQKAWDEWMALDDQFANYVEDSARMHGFASFRTDFSTTEEDLVSLATSHFELAD